MTELRSAGHLMHSSGGLTDYSSFSFQYSLALTKACCSLWSKVRRVCSWLDDCLAERVGVGRGGGRKLSFAGEALWAYRGQRGPRNADAWCRCRSQISRHETNHTSTPYVSLCPRAIFLSTLIRCKVCSASPKRPHRLWVPSCLLSKGYWGLFFGG